MKYPDMRIAIAGASGYLGSYIVKESINRNIKSRVIVRDQSKLRNISDTVEVVQAEVTNRESIKGIFDAIDVVISSVGITRQKDGLTYMDVDYQANVNLIDEAKTSGVKKFIYVSVLNGDKLRETKICEAKEKLGDYLKASGMDFCIIRPNGFFSDMGDFLTMAKKGKVYLFGNGGLRLNPIHGEDLAKVILDSIETNEKEVKAGGPDLLSQNEIASLALSAYDKPIKIIHLPDWIRKVTLWILRTFTSSKFYGPIEFFMTTIVLEMEAPCYGKHRLQTYFKENTR